MLAACAAPPSRPNPCNDIDIADAALRGGSPQIALRLVGQVLATDPGNLRALVIQGDALNGLGQTDEAEASYRAALAIQPTLVPAEIGLGRCVLPHDPQSAEGLFLQASINAPRNPTAFIDLGVARDLMHRHADAQIAYRQALAVDPQQIAAQVNLALSLAMSGRGEEAVRMMRPLAEAPRASRKLHHDFAAVLAMSGQRAEAERILSADLPPAEVAQAIASYSSAVDQPANALTAAP